jgi:hypothetical protein
VPRPGPFGTLAAWAVAILVLPPAGAWAAGVPLGDYLSFPLVRRAWDPLPYRAWVYWASLAGLAGLAGILARMTAGRPAAPAPAAPSPAGPARPFPTWGWIGVACLPAALALGLAGGGAAAYPLFLAGLTAALNADLLRRTGSALPTTRPAYFAALFPGGLLLGWLIHYLNLFAQSWTYPALAGHGAAYTVLVHSPAYALLLPLLLTVRQWVGSHPPLLRRLTHGRPLSAPAVRHGAWLLVAFGALGLAGAGVWPDHAYPLTWLSPLLLALGLQRLAGRATPLDGVGRGDWSRVASTALAAIAIGLLDLLWGALFGGERAYALSVLQGPALLGLPLPAFAQLPVLGLTALWLADQINTPWRSRKRPPFPVRISIGDP